MENSNIPPQHQMVETSGGQHLPDNEVPVNSSPYSEPAPVFKSYNPAVNPQVPFQETHLKSYAQGAQPQAPTPAAAPPQAPQPQPYQPQPQPYQPQPQPYQQPVAPPAPPVNYSRPQAPQAPQPIYDREPAQYNQHQNQFSSEDEAYNDYFGRLSHLAQDADAGGDPNVILNDLFDKGYTVEQAEYHLKQTLNVADQAWNQQNAHQEAQLESTEQYLKGAWGGNFQKNMDDVLGHINQISGSDSEAEQTLMGLMQNPQLVQNYYNSLGRQGGNIPTSQGITDNYPQQQNAQTLDAEYKGILADPENTINNVDPRARQHYLKRLDAIENMTYEMESRKPRPFGG